MRNNTYKLITWVILLSCIVGLPEPWATTLEQVNTTSTQTLTNKTLTSAKLNTNLTLNQTTANYTLQWNDPAAGRTLTIPDPGGADTFTFNSATQTLTNKTITSPTISGASMTTTKQLNANVVSLDKFSTTDICATNTGAIDQIGATVTTLLISTAASCSQNKTIPITLTLWFAGSGQITIADAATLTMKGRIESPIKQIFVLTGTGKADTTSLQNEWIFTEWWGAVGDGTTNDYAAINNAILSGRRYIRLLKKAYAYGTTLTIADGTTGLTLEGDAYAGWAELRYTPATGDGIDFAKEADNFVMHNVYISSPNSSTGWAISSQSPGANPLRDTLLDNVSWTGFKNGMRVESGINITVRGGRQTGQGKAVAGGVGFLLGLNGLVAINHMIIEDIYVASYETDVHNQSTGALNIVSSIIGNSATGLLIDSSRIVMANNIYFDSNNDTAINNNGGYLAYGANFSSSGTQTVTSASHRMFKIGHNLTRVSAYRVGDQTITTGVATKVLFDGETFDDEGYFDSVTNNRFVANYPAFYSVDALVRFATGTANKNYIAMLYVNGVKKAEAYHLTDATAVQTVSIPISGLFWLNANDYVELFVQHDEGVNSTVKGGAISTYMNIRD